MYFFALYSLLTILVLGFISSRDIILRSIFLYRLYKGIVLMSKFRRDLWSVKPCIFRKQNTLSVSIVHKCLRPSFTFQNLSHVWNNNIKIFNFQECVTWTANKIQPSFILCWHKEDLIPLTFYANEMMLILGERPRMAGNPQNLFPILKSKWNEQSIERYKSYPSEPSKP